MYLITWREDDSIADFSNDIKYLCNGDPFIPETNVSYPINCINVFAVDGTPMIFLRADSVMRNPGVSTKIQTGANPLPMT